MLVRGLAAVAAVALWPAVLPAQAPGKFPPDSLINPKVFDKKTPVIEVVGAMRNFAGALGVRCQYCHVGEEGWPLEKFDFASDEKRTKLTARVMMKTVEEANRRFTEIPQRPAAKVDVTCHTCHRGVPRPIPLVDLLGEAASAGGVDSVARSYRALRDQFYGRASYDFGENTLNTLALRLTRGQKADQGLGVVEINAEFFPRASSVPFTRGEILLAKRDTAAALAEYRKAVAIDGNPQAQQRVGSLTR